MQSSGGLADAELAAGHAALTVLSGPAGGAAAAALLAERTGTPGPPVLRHGRHVVRRLRRRGRARARDRRAARSAGGRSRCRWSTSTRSAPAAARSPGATRAARCASARARRAPTPGPRATAAAAPSRRSPTRTSCSACSTAHRWPGRRARPRRGRARAGDARPRRREAAAGIVRVANAEMVRALRVMTVERGVDPRDFALLAFGGAGALHAAGIAEELGIGAHPLPARERRAQRARARGRRPPRRRAAHGARRARSTSTTLAAEARERLGEPDAEIDVAYDCRYRGQSFELTVDDPGRLPRRPRGALRLPRARTARSRSSPSASPRGCRRRASSSRAGRPRRARARDRAPRCSASETAVLRGELPPGTRIAGPGGVRAARGDARRARGLAGRRSTTTGRWCSIDAVELQVATGALRAACEEMGAVLVRAAHSANIKERRDCSTALFDPRGQMVMQAEHIPVHLGAMPAAVAAVLGERPRARALVDPQRPVRGRHAPARHHGRHAGLPRARRRRAARLRRQPRPPRRRRRPRPGLDARRLDDARRGGRRHRAAAARRTSSSRSSPRRCASPPSAAPTCAPSSPPTRPARGGWPSSPRASAPSGSRAATAEVLDYAERRTRAHARRDGRRRPPRRSTCSRRARATSSCGCARRSRRRARPRLRRQRAPARRQPQLPAGGHALGVPVRPARAHRPRHPGERGRRAAARRCIAPEGSLLNARSPAAVVGGNVETSSRVADLVLRAFGRALGQGTMNNLTLGNGARSPTTRRSAAARARARTPTGRAACTSR